MTDKREKIFEILHNLDPEDRESGDWWDQVDAATDEVMALSDWTSVNEPPEEHGYYAVALNSPKIEGVSVAEAYWAGDRWDWGVSIRYANHMEISVILWQPLPAPPEDK